MYVNKKTLLLAALILGAASEALADGLDIYQVTIQSTQQWPNPRRQSQTHAKTLASDHASLGWASVHPEWTISRERGAAKRRGANVATCPWLEGYPDCHPDTQGY
jgi:hypothetical protein